MTGAYPPAPPCPNSGRNSADFKSDIETNAVIEAVDQSKESCWLPGSVEVDNRTEVTPDLSSTTGRCAAFDEDRLSKDVEKGTVALARHDRPGREGKSFIPQVGIATVVQDVLRGYSKIPPTKHATSFRDSHIHDPKDYAELIQVVQNGWAYSYWCES